MTIPSSEYVEVTTNVIGGEGADGAGGGGNVPPSIVAYWGSIVGNILDQDDLIQYIADHAPAPVWGNITGDIDNQDDLAERLNDINVAIARLDALGKGKQLNVNWGILADSRDRQAITPTGSIATLRSYDSVSHMKTAGGGRIKIQVIAGNQGFDVRETLNVLDTNRPSNADTSTGAGAVTVWGFKDFDTKTLGGLLIHLGINYFPDFNFTLPTFAEREAINSVVRARIQVDVEELLNHPKIRAVPYVMWQTEGPVGAASTNWNNGDTIERGYVWHLKWYNSLLREMRAKYANLVVGDVTELLADTGSDKWIAMRYAMLSSDGLQANQDMHPTFWSMRKFGKKHWDMAAPFLQSAPLGFPTTKSDKMSISRDSFNVKNDSLLLAAASNTPKVLYGGGTGTTVPVNDANISGQMPATMAVQVNQTLGVTPGNFTFVCKMLDLSPSGFGRAIQCDITFNNVDFDGSIGYGLYDLGVDVNAMIDAGFLTFNENKVIQSCMYMKAGLAGANDGEVLNASAFRAFSGQQRCRTVGNNQFTTASSFGAANSNTDFSTKTEGLQLPGQFEGPISSPAVKLEGITPLTPNRLQTRSITAPNTNEYLYFNVNAKCTVGQKFRIIASNIGLYVAPMPADGIIRDLI